jgi:hypothetical protein
MGLNLNTTEDIKTLGHSASPTPKIQDTSPNGWQRRNSRNPIGQATVALLQTNRENMLNLR